MPIAPVIDSITFDKPSYIRGDTITVTVVYEAGLSDLTQSFVGVATDQSTGQEGTLTSTFVISGALTDPTTASGSDTGGRSWNKISDGGGEAVFTATA